MIPLAAAVPRRRGIRTRQVDAEGVKENGKEKMKGYSDKLSADEIAALVKHIRGFAAPAK